MSDRALLFDIGNTTIKIGVAVSPGPESGPEGRTDAAACGSRTRSPDCRDRQTREDAPAGVATSYRLPTDSSQTADSLGIALRAIMDHAGLERAAGALACSVAPGVNSLLRQACERYAGSGLRFTPEDVPIALENRYERGWEVGADRLVGAYAARRRQASEGVIVVDFGTATTFDCVVGDAYMGGLICPGVLSSAEALSSRTAKLPRISLDAPGETPVIGRSTAESLSHGLVHGFASMVEGVSARLRRVMPRDVTVVAAGGLGAVIARVTDCFDDVRPDLLLEGLYHLYMER